LLVALSSKCPICELETESYRQLENAQQLPTKPKITYTMPQDEKNGQDYLNRHGLQGKGQFSTSFIGTGIERFPTILLVNEKGTVLLSHVGAMNQSERKSLTDVLSSCPVELPKAGATLCP
ncbi:MAG: TlpA family protein disulfide reductase, partial [Acidobacteriota bacterium]